MAGPTVLALGPFQFEAMGFSYQGRNRESDMKWAEIEIAGGQDVLQWTGGKNRAETIRGVLFEEFGGQGALEGLKLASETGLVLPLVDLGGGLFNVFGMHIIEGVNEDLSFVDRNGVPLKNRYQIKIKAYNGSIGSNLVSSVLSLFN